MKLNADKNRQQATMNTKRRLMEDEACAVVQQTAGKD